MKSMWMGTCAALLGGTLAVACGGGTDGTGAVAPATPSYSTGVMVKGSVIVNGVKYDDSAGAPAQVIDDRGRGFGQLDDGMVIKLRGRINDDGRTGVAQVVKVSNELRGVVTAVNTAANPPTITVQGVLVQTDESTVLANGLVLSAALIGQVVEVHGLRDAGGTLRATRIEVPSGTGLSDEFKGPISSVSGAAFVVAGVTVTPAANAQYFPTGCSFAALRPGLVVEVRGTFTGINVFSATRIECEDLADDNAGVRPPAGARNEIEGFVSNLTSADNNVSGSFTIGTMTVSFGPATQFRNGGRADLVNGVRVEVDGTIAGGTLNAREISFKQERIILQGTISAVGSSTLTVLGQTVRRNDLTRIDSGVSLTVGSRVQVRARFVDNALIADEIRAPSGGSSGNREIVQARATARSGDTITLLGTPYTLGPGTACKDSRGASEVPISCAALLDAVSAALPNGTLVKVRGEPLASGVTEAELED